MLPQLRWIGSALGESDQSNLLCARAQVTAYRAGHVLGAAMFMVEIAGLRVLYTGDYSRLADRHLSAADLPELKPDVGAQSRDRTHVPLSLMVRSVAGLGRGSCACIGEGPSAHVLSLVLSAGTRPTTEAGHPVCHYCGC